MQEVLNWWFLQCPDDGGKLSQMGCVHGCAADFIKFLFLMYFSKNIAAKTITHCIFFSCCLSCPGGQYGGLVDDNGSDLVVWQLPISHCNTVRQFKVILTLEYCVILALSLFVLPVLPPPSFTRGFMLFFFSPYFVKISHDSMSHVQPVRHHCNCIVFELPVSMFTSAVFKGQQCPLSLHLHPLLDRNYILV